MSYKNIKEKFFDILTFVIFLLCFLAFSNVGFLFAAAPTVTTGSASSVTKTSATLIGSVLNNGGQEVTSTGFNYGTTLSYGSLVSGAISYVFDSGFGSYNIVGGNGDFSLAGKIAFDSLGNIFVTDYEFDRVQKFNSAGVYQSQFGTTGSGNGEFDRISGIAIDSLDNIFVLDYENNRVQKFNSAGVYQSQFGTTGSGNGEFNQPRDIAIDSQDNIYVVDNLNSRVQKFNSAGVFQFEISPISGPIDIAIDSQDNIYVSENSTHFVNKYNSTGVLQFQIGVNGGGSGNGEFNSPMTLAVDSLDNLLVLDFSNGRIQKFNSSGVYQSDFSSPYGSILGGGFPGFAFDSSDNLYLSQGNNFPIEKWTNNGIVFNLSGLSCGTTYHYRAFATNADGTSYGNDATFTTLDCEPPIVVTTKANDITKTSITFNGLQESNGVSPSTVRGIEYGLTTSYGNTIYANRNSLSFYSLDFSATPGLDDGGDITKDSSGNFYITSPGSASFYIYDQFSSLIFGVGYGVETGASQLEKCTSSCLVGISGSASDQLNTPSGIAVDDSEAGDIYVADELNDKVVRFDADGNFISQFYVDSPRDILIYRSNPTFEIIVLSECSVKKFNISGAIISQTGTCGTGVSQMNDAKSFAFDSTYTNIFIVDSGNDRIKVLDRESMTLNNVSFNNDIGLTPIQNPTGIAIGPRNSLFISDLIPALDTRIIYAAYDNESGGDLNYSFNEDFNGLYPNYSGFSDDGYIYKIYSDGSEMIYGTTINTEAAVTLSPFIVGYVKNLECNTTYNYRAFATNADGTAYGDNMVAKTKPCNFTSGSGGGGGPTPPAEGCTDPAALNYEPAYEVDDGSCQYPVYGCIDYTAVNYNPAVTNDDGSCVYSNTPVLGCIDITATNYNPLATQDDGSCTYDGGGGPDDNDDDILGCTDSFATNYNPLATQDDGSCEYVINYTYGCIDPDALNYNPLANLNDGSCTYFTPPVNWPPVLPPIISIINDVIQDVTGWDEEEQEEVYKDIGIAGLIIPPLLYALSQRAAIASVLIRLWNLIPTILGFRRRQRPWGTVYDSITKQPLDPVYVTLKDFSGNEVGNSITDLDGRYGFVTDIGQFFINAKKSDYIFPSEKMKGKESDDLYNNLYFGEEIKIEDPDTIINKNIPMDAINFNWNEFEKTKNKKLMKFFSKTELFIARIAKIIFIAGFVTSFLLVFLEPKLWNYIVLGIYVLVWGISLLGFKPKRPGYIFEKGTGYPMSFSVIYVFSALLNKEVAHTVVGKTGRYHLLVPKGSYYLKIKKKTGEQTYEDVLTTDIFKVKKGYINKIIKI